MAIYWESEIKRRQSHLVGLKQEQVNIIYCESCRKNQQTNSRPDSTDEHKSKHQQKQNRTEAYFSTAKNKQHFCYCKFEPMLEMVLSTV